MANEMRELVLDADSLSEAPAPERLREVLRSRRCGRSSSAIYTVRAAPRRPQCTSTAARRITHLGIDLGDGAEHDALGPVYGT